LRHFLQRRSAVFHWNDWPLTIKLTLVMSVLVIAAVTIVSLAYIHNEQRVAHQEMEEQARTILASLAVASSDEIYFSDTNKLSDIARRLDQTTNLSDVQFYDRSGRLIGDATDATAVQRFEPDPWGQTLIENNATSYSWLEKRLVAGQSITIGPDIYGAISIEISTDTLDARLAAIRNQGLIVALAAAIAGAWVSLLVSRPVTLPLKELAAATLSIGQGDFKFVSSIDQKDEVGVLSRSFAEMADHLAQSREGLENRTHQLSETADKLRNSTVSINYLDNILASMADTLIVVDTEFIIRKANPAACALLGYPESELIGRPFRSVLAHDDFEDDLLYQVLVQGLTRKVEGGYVSRNGAVTPVSFSSSRMLDEDGRCEGTVCVAQDITQRRRDHQALISARQDALEASRAKSEFLASMSHEIRTPMNAILGMANVLIKTPLTSDQKEYVKLFQSAGSSLLALINDILDISKIEAGKLELEEISFDLVALVEDTVQIMALDAHQKGLELCLQIQQGTATSLTGDPARLRQIIINLIGNAVKFTEHGEIVLCIENDANIDNSGFLLFSVSDTGVGIPAQHLGSVFDAFTQADSSITRKHGGTGLGLTISGQLVERMGGHIWVESEVGKGSTFRFNAHLASPTVGEPSSDRSSGQFSGVRILILEPNATNSTILKELLAGWGAIVTNTSDYRSGIAELGQACRTGSPYQLVMLNRRLPDMDGFEAVPNIQHDYRDIGILMMLTTEQQSEDIDQCHALGISNYVVKPVKASRLAEVTARALDRPVDLEATSEAALPECQRPLNILLVEDHKNNRLVIQAYLNQTPFQIDFAENGEIAVQKSESKAYDLILMDIRMPVMDGLTATRNIREREARLELPPTPIIALTANHSKEDVSNCIHAGVDAYLTKPIDPGALLQSIKIHTGGVSV
jgi:PAS domain S-box-containing protein